MKKIEAVIRPEKLKLLTEKLKSMGLKELNTVELNNHNLETEVKVTKIKVEFALNYAELDKYVEAIKNTAYTGEIGDGKIFVSDLENVVKIRTAEEGVKAL
jgi:nitrogen regulatory protein P-II 1